MTTYSADLTGWRAHAAARGDSAPTDATDALAGAALQRGADYIRSRYVARMAVGTDTTDARITEAIYIASDQELASPGFWNATYTPSQIKILTRVDNIQWTPAAGADASGPDMQRPMSAAIEELLYPLMVSRIGTMVV